MIFKECPYREYSSGYKMADGQYLPGDEPGEICTKLDNWCNINKNCNPGNCWRLDQTDKVCPDCLDAFDGELPDDINFKMYYDKEDGIMTCPLCNFNLKGDK